MINKLFHGRYYFPISLLLLLFFFLSLNLVFYSFLKSIFGVLAAYLIDQFFFFFCILVVFTIGICKKQIRLSWKIILSILVYIILVLLFQSEILNRFFIKDDYHVMFVRLNNPATLDIALSNRQFFFYYHYAMFSLLFAFFKYNAFFYNLVTLATMGFATAMFFYLLKFIGSIRKYKTTLLAIFTSLAFVFTSVYMDAYLYTEHAVAIGYIVTGVILSLYCYLKFLENKKISIFFILSYVLTLFLLRTAFTRTGFWPICLLLLETIYFFRQKNDKTGFVFRSLLIAITFLLIAKPYLMPTGERVYGIGIDRFINADRIYLFFASIPLSFMPYQIYAWIYHSIMAGHDTVALAENAIHNNVFFYMGILIFIAISIIILLTFLLKKNNKLLIFSWLSFIVSLSFYNLFGNVTKTPFAHSFDLAFILFGMVPGSRYYPLPYLFMLLTLYLLTQNFLSLFKKRVKTIFYGSIVILLSLLIVNNIIYTQRTNEDADIGIVALKIITEHVLQMVPDNKEEKVIYSSNGLIQPISFLGWDGFNSLYKNRPPMYLDSKAEAMDYLSKHSIVKNNFYAFYFSGNSAFKNTTSEEREVFRNYFH